jgi:hypothetical protein
MTRRPQLCGNRWLARGSIEFMAGIAVPAIDDEGDVDIGDPLRI